MSEGLREALRSACLRLQGFLDTFGDVGDATTQADINDWFDLTDDCAALAQPEAVEPVAWRWRVVGDTSWTIVRTKPVINAGTPARFDVEIEPLYTAPPLAPDERMRREISLYPTWKLEHLPATKDGERK